MLRLGEGLGVSSTPTLVFANGESALLIIGLWKTHKTDPWRAVAAVFLPLVLCFCCMCLAASAGMAATANALNAMGK